MREYLLRLLGIFFVVGIGEMLLPDGNLKKYAKIVMSILICHVMLSPSGILPEFDIEAEYKKATIHDSFESDVMAEYKKRIEESISARSGYGCDVELYEDNTIKKVISYGKISDETRKYITNELGVLENDIEIREN